MSFVKCLVVVAFVSAGSLPPGVAGAADTTIADWFGLTAAASSCAAGDTITLDADIDNPDGTYLNFSSCTAITVDLNGFNLTIDAVADDDPGVGVPVGAHLTITDTSTGVAGHLNTAGGSGGAGIGGGDSGDGGSVTVSGGTVTANGGSGGAGIGGGYEGAGGSFVMSGGTVTATGGTNGAGLGGGSIGSGVVVVDSGSFVMSGGTVIATGGSGGAGIGGGDYGDGGSVTVSGGTVTANGGYGGAGIGGGDNGVGGSVSVSGGTVTATGGRSGAGIGGGTIRGGGSVVVSGGTVTAIGGQDAAGIGCGDFGSGAGSLTLLGTALSSSTATTGGQNGVATAPTIVVGAGPLLYEAFAPTEPGMFEVVFGVGAAVFEDWVNSTSGSVFTDSVVLPDVVVPVGWESLGWRVDGAGAPVSDPFEPVGVVTLVANAANVLLSPTTVAAGDTALVSVETYTGSGVTGTASGVTVSGDGLSVDGLGVLSTKAGDYTVDVSFAGVMWELLLEVTPGPATGDVVVDPTNPDIGAVGDTATFGALKVDEYGNVVEDATVTAMSSFPGDSVSGADVSFGFDPAGLGAPTERTITLTTSSGASVSMVVAVDSGVANIVATPSSNTVDQGDTVTVTAIAVDGNGETLGDITDYITLASNVSTDVVNANTVRFPTASPHTITIGYGNFNSTTIIEVTSPPTTTIVAELPATGSTTSASTWAAIIIGAGIMLLAASRRRTTNPAT